MSAAFRGLATLPLTKPFNEDVNGRLLAVSARYGFVVFGSERGMWPPVDCSSFPFHMALTFFFFFGGSVGFSLADTAGLLKQANPSQAVEVTPV